MTQISWPWYTNPPSGGDGDGAQGLNEQRSREFLATYFGAQDITKEGVCKGVLSELAISGTASPLTVAPGAAICYGMFISDSNVTLPVTTPTNGLTGGLVVLRTNWAGFGDGDVGEATTRLAIKLNTDGISSIPTLTQVAGQRWEIALAAFTIATNGTITITNTYTPDKWRRFPGMAGPGSVLASSMTTNAIQTAHITNGAVTAAKAGAGVPTVAKRRGGSSTVWRTAGNTFYDVSAVRMVFGSISVVPNPGSPPLGGEETAFNLSSLPGVFSAGSRPMVFTTAVAYEGETMRVITAGEVDASGNVRIRYEIEGNQPTSITIHYMLVGPGA